jgi:RNA-dependent RNA polymerase
VNLATTRAIGIVKGDIEEIKDVERNGFQFTDGVGLMSPFLAEMIAIDMKVKKDNIIPSAYQFRLGGCKGVLSVSPRLKHRKVAIRKSQKKFDAEHVGFEINRVADYSSSALNRQLIIILSSLGVPDKVFIHKLKTMLTNLDLAMEDERICLQQLCKNVDQNGTSLLVAGWVRLGFMKVKEPFVMAMINLWRAWSIKYLKEKARIIIEEGAFVLGVADDSGESDDVPGVLQGHIDGTDQDDPKNWPEIFLQISDPEDRTQFRIITGPCVIARNPSLHPGDVRVVTAVDRKELHHHRNVVVFPRNGDRDIPHMLSGGDLDGDDYIIIWDKDLMPTVKNFPPMDYSAPPAKTKGEGEVTVDDLVEFFLDYLRNDRLGTIANSHLAWADEDEDGAMSERCKLHVTMSSPF